MRRYETWDPASERLPATATQAREDAKALDDACAPAPRAVIATLVAKTLVLFDPPADPKAADARTRSIIEALEDIPLDIVESTLKRVRMELTFFPRPAEVRERAMAERGERKRLATKARVAAHMAAQREPAPERSPPTDEDRARVSAAVSRLAQTRETIAKSRVEERPARPVREALAIVAKETMAFRLPDLDDPHVVDIMARMDGDGAA